MRIIIERPLVMLFEMQPEDALVSVIAVFEWRRRR